MKRLHIIRSVNPEGGGPIEGIMQLAKVTETMGHQVEIVSLDSPNERFVKNCSLPIFALGPSLGNYGYNNQFKPWLTSRSAEYDAIIVNGLWQYHSYAAHSVLTQKKTPYFVFTHGMLDPWFKHHYPFKHIKKSLYWRLGEYPVLRDAAKVLFTSEAERLSAIQSFWPYRCHEQVVHYGTHGQIGDKQRQRTLFLTEHPHLEGKRCLLCLSRIHPKKGIDILIQSFARICQNDKDLHLLISGPDQIGWQMQLQGLAEQLGISRYITWTGMLTGDMKWGAYLSADAFVLPSHQENFGIVVAEALSCGKPVLISDKINIYREIAAAGAGFVDQDTVAGTVRNLQRWLALPANEAALMSERAEVCFQERFHIRKAAEHLLEILYKPSS